MDDVRYMPRRTGVGFEIEDTRSGLKVDGEFDDFFEASQAARRRERSEWAGELAEKVEAAGSPEIAADIRRGIPRATMLARLQEMGEAQSEVAEIIASAPREP